MDDAEREALRRRLYSADATESDLRRYRDEAPRDAPGAEDPPTGGPGARPSRRGLLLAGGVLVVGAAGVVAVAGRGVPRDVVPTATTPPTPLAARASDLPDVVFADAGVVFTREGAGDETVPLDAALGRDGGAVTVQLAAHQREEPVAWRLVREGGAGPHLLAARPVSVPEPDEAPVLLPALPRAPDRVLVEAAEGVRWTLIVTFVR